MKNLKVRIISVVCILAMFMSLVTVFSISTSAASVTQKFNCDNSVTFTVKTTSKSPSIKLVCDAAKESNHKCSRAPYMAITVSPALKDGNFFIIKGCGRNISSTLKLEKNKTYTIKVSYYVNKVNKCDNGIFGDHCRVFYHDITSSTIYRGLNRRDIYVNGNWYISKVTNCTISNIKVR